MTVACFFTLPCYYDAPLLQPSRSVVCNLYCLLPRRMQILFIGFCAAPEMCIISEYMARGSLYSIMRAQDGRPLEPKLQRTVAISVARGMAYLHSRTPPILHLVRRAARTHPLLML